MITGLTSSNEYLGSQPAIIPGEVKQSTSDGRQFGELLSQVEKFGDVVGNFSKFEMAMAGTGSLVTKGAKDWIAYFLESAAEFIENSLIGDKVPSFLQPILKTIADIHGIRNEQGDKLKNEELILHKEKIIGGLNHLTSIGSIINTTLHVIKNFFTGDLGRTSKPLTLLAIPSKIILPSINALLMWASGVGKKLIANKAQTIKSDLSLKEKTDINGAMTSGNQDWLCGLNSALLMVRQVIESFSPKLGAILEPLFAYYISISCYREARKNFADQHEDDNQVKYSLSWADKVFGQPLYKIAQKASEIFGVQLPDYFMLETKSS